VAPDLEGQTARAEKKFERIIGFFWFCVRRGWLHENPTATMGRVIAKHVPANYFNAEEYQRIVGATCRLDEDVEKSGVRIRTLT
jgi:hypothetical protein